jgi:hypothetical protein
MNRVLSNPALAGLRVHQGNVVGKGTWQPIITEAQHHQVVAQMKRAKLAYGFTSRPGPDPKYLLTGIAKCGKCDEGLRMKRWGSTKRNPSYVCYRGHCCRVAHAMDAAVEKALFERLAQVDPADYESDDPIVAEAVRQIEELEDKLEDWTQSAVAGDITPQAFAKIEKGLRGRIAELSPKTAGKARPNPMPIEGLEKNWKRITMRQKRDIVRALVKVTVIPAERRGARTGQLLIEQIWTYR